MSAARGSTPLRAVVFDCDGTLVDSETVTERAMRRALAEQGVELTQDAFASMVGHPWPRTRARMQELFGMGEAEVAAYEAAMRRHVVPLLEDPSLVFDDVVATLDALADRDVPVAVCTSSSRDHLERVLALPGLVGRFAVRVAREDTTEHKPSATPYLRALELLAARSGRGLVPAGATVVEDSSVGVAAGLAAGCWTVAVDRGHGLHDLSGADVVTERLSPRDLRSGERSPGLS